MSSGQPAGAARLPQRRLARGCRFGRRRALSPQPSTPCTCLRLRRSSAACGTASTTCRRASVPLFRRLWRGRRRGRPTLSCSTRHVPPPSTSLAACRRRATRCPSGPGDGGGARGCCWSSGWRRCVPPPTPPPSGSSPPPPVGPHSQLARLSQIRNGHAGLKKESPLLQQAAWPLARATLLALQLAPGPEGGEGFSVLSAREESHVHGIVRGLVRACHRRALLGLREGQPQ